MSNTEELQEVVSIEEKQTDNEKKEIKIDVNINTNNDAFANEFTDTNKNFSKEEKDRKGEANIFSIELEPQDNVLVKLNATDDKQNAVVKPVGGQKTGPDVWVQFQEVKPNTRRDGIFGFGKQTVERGKHYHPQDPGGGGHFEYDPRSRNSFVLFVFTIVLVMLSLTALYNICILNSPSATEFYIINRRALALTSAGVLIAMSYAIVCCLDLIRMTPCNVIALLIVLVAMSNMVAVLTTVIRTEIIIFALIGTSITVAVCLILAMSSFDFTAWYLYLVAIMVVFMVISVMLAMGSLFLNIHFKPLHTAMLYIGTLLQVILLIMELQMILGGRSIEMGEHEYVLAAYFLYTSIVNLFLQILQILADLDSD